VRYEFSLNLLVYFLFCVVFACTVFYFHSWKTCVCCIYTSAWRDGYYSLYLIFFALNILILYLKKEERFLLLKFDD